MTSKKLLVVDDEIGFAKFVEGVAEDLDFDVLLTDDPLEFGNLYSNDIDIVVLDLFMPNTDGIELLRFLSDNKSKASVILMSGKDAGVLHTAQELALEQGVKVLGVLQKPFRSEDLEKVLNKFEKVSAKSAPNSDNGGLPSLDELKQAIIDKELFLHFQPQVEIRSRKVVGVEALARWSHRDKGMIPPSYFIPLAEENDLMHNITFATATKAIQQQGIWKEQGTNLRVSINMSPKSLYNLNVPEDLETYAKEANADISKIMIEVTETALMADVARYMDILVRLRMKGFGLSIDDFGTGYSSLQQLVRVPFTELKVDQAFVRKLTTDAECRTITKISILLAHELGMSVVAEGIETEADWNILDELECDEGQGYWMGKPMPAEDIPAWITRWKNR